jgi:coenzyme F420-reducing hydrogenase beta subunit
VLEDDTRIEKHTFYFNQYQNLYFFCSKKCLSCHDHFGYDADICLGDAWLYDLKKNKIKHNTVIVKTGSGLDIINKCFSSGIIQLQSISIEKVLDIQARSVRLHYNVTSRSKAAKRYGIHIVDKVHVKTRWVDDILARLILFNFHRSNSKNASAIFKLPKPIIKLYLYLFKILEII